MSEVRSGTVDVRGAQLYYEVRGQGDPLLLIQGGISDAAATAQLAAELAERYQVISYDRRGISRSTAAGDVPVTMPQHAEDAARLLEACTDRPARVLGSSIGAVIALHLAAEHPGRVATVIAHEPPLSSVLREQDREAELDTVAELARTDVRGAIRHMVTISAHQGEPEEGARPGKPAGDPNANLEFFFAHDFPAVRASALRAEQLAAVPVTVRPTGGSEGASRWEYRCAQQLAKELDGTFTEVPGGHMAPSSHPRGTAEAVRRLLAE
ncbi:alpha/beta fold hydrolase [Sciscionella marina]|uniref:alpha/beta fold hydrolase n=1 Tax=Sciscionella marina TaxID=508770 RepID=UPI000365C085|nr:alpha/beta hydrolase [Sciscionella marina]